MYELIFATFTTKVKVEVFLDLPIRFFIYIYNIIYVVSKIIYEFVLKCF